MQIQMQALGRRGGSLRIIIADDLTKHPHKTLYLQQFKNPKRTPGWSKIKGRDLAGAINLKWDPNSHMLIARAIAKKENTPHELLGEFLTYLIDRHGKKITSINIQLR